MTAWKPSPSLSCDDDAKKKKAFKREDDSYFNWKRGGNKRDFVVKDDAQYFEDLLFGEAVSYTHLTLPTKRIV